ncbi:unnamed protein product [Arabidopsis halleri]
MLAAAYGRDMVRELRCCFHRFNGQTLWSICLILGEVESARA